MAGIFEELLVRDDICHLAPIFTRYCIAASFFLISQRPIPELWAACQSDLQVLKLSLKELSKRWKSAIGGSRVLESILTSQQHNTGISMKRIAWLTQDEQFLFNEFPLDLCQMWGPYAQFCEKTADAQEGRGVPSPDPAGQELPNSLAPLNTHNIPDAVPFTPIPESDLPDLSLADFLCEGLENWLGPE